MSLGEAGAAGDRELIRRALQLLPGGPEWLSRRSLAVASKLDTLVELCRASGNGFDQQAVLDAYDLDHGLSPDARQALGELNLGIPPGPLADLRRAVLQNCPDPKSTPEDVRLLVWGPSAQRGQVLYRELGVLLKAEYLDSAGPCNPPSRPSKYSVLHHWLELAGVHHKAREASRGLMQRSFFRHALARHPLGSGFESLTHQGLGLARSLSAGDSVLALRVFQCLARVCAYERPWVDFGNSPGDRPDDQPVDRPDDLRGSYYIQWRSTWLCGPRRDQRAIPGVTTYQKRLHELLMREVLEPVGGYKPGAKAQAYRVRVRLERGDVSVPAAAGILGYEIDAGTGKLRRRS